MSDDGGEEEQEQKKFFVDRAKTGRATCKKCKQKLESGELRLAKSGVNPFGPGVMKLWHHVSCLFEVFTKQRATTAKIETPDDIDGWSDLDEDDQKDILGHLPKCKDWKTTPKTLSKDKDDKGSKKKARPDKGKTPKDKDKDKPEKSKNDSTPASKEGHKDDSFREFRRLCAALSETDSYTGKTALVKEFFTKGTDGSSFKGDLNLWCRLLLPGAVKRVYNLQSKQLIKLFSKIFHADQDEMLEDLEQGDVAETVRVFFEKSKHLHPTKKSNLTIQDVDKFLEELSGMTKEDEQTLHFKQMAKKCTSNDLKMIVRLVKHDLRINAGPKHILEAVHPDAYQAFQTSRDIDVVLLKAVGKEGDTSSKKTSLKISASVMTPVLPMLSNGDSEDNKEQNGSINGEKEENHNINTEENKKRSHDEIDDEEDKPISKKRRVTSHHHNDNSSKLEDKRSPSPSQHKSTDKNETEKSSEQLVLPEEDDQFSIFGDYVAQELRELKCEVNRRELKRIIEKAIIEMAEKDDSDNLEETANVEPENSQISSENCQLKTEKPATPMEIEDSSQLEKEEDNLVIEKTDDNSLLEKTENTSAPEESEDFPLPEKSEDSSVSKKLEDSSPIKNGSSLSKI